jgi:ubiquinone biosynthesis protein
VGVFAKHGFQNIAEQIRLGRYILSRFSQEDLDKYTAPERARMAFEQLGPTFVKFGQLLATRPDLIPSDFVDEFKKLHDQVTPVEFAEIRPVLEAQFHKGLDEVFSFFDERPMAAASIAQVHRAILKNGDRVVVKVQRPGIDKLIQEDLSVLYLIAQLVVKYVPEARLFNPIGIVDEFFKTLELEINFVVEANNIRKFARNFAEDPTVIIPHVHMELSGPKVLVLEQLEGIPLSSPNSLMQPGVDPYAVLAHGLKVYLKMVFEHGFFHGDLHAGNVFVYPENRIGLVDFGVVGRLQRRVQDAIVSMLHALAHEDYERLAFEYVDLAPVNDRLDVDRLATDVRDVIAPYFGLTMRNVNMGKILLDSTAVAARHGLVLPSELMLFFKSMISIEGMGRLIADDFDFLQAATEFSSDIAQKRFAPARIWQDVQGVGRDSSQLLFALPRQLRMAFRKINSPQFSIKLRFSQVEDLRRSIEISSHMIFLGLVISGLVVSGAVTFSAQAHSIDPSYVILGLPPISAICFGLATMLGLLAFFEYFRKS